MCRFVFIEFLPLFICALDGSCFLTPFVFARLFFHATQSEEIIEFRNLKPSTGERRDAISIPPEVVDMSSAMVVEENNGEEKPAESSLQKKSDETDADQPTSAEARQQAPEDDKADDDSNEAVGKEEAAEQDRDMMGGDGDGEEEVDASTGRKVTTMFQKILSLGGQSGQVVVNVDGEDGEEPEAPAAPAVSAPTGPSASQPTLIHNGRMVSMKTVQLH